MPPDYRSKAWNIKGLKGNSKKGNKEAKYQRENCRFRKGDDKVKETTMFLKLIAEIVELIIDAY